MEHPELAQFAALAGGAGAALLIAGRGRIVVLVSLTLIALGEVGLAAALPSVSDKLDSFSSAQGAAALAGGGAALVAGATLFVRRPAWVPFAILLAAPFRPPITFDAGSGFPIGIATDGQLGRLLPLYAVLACAGLALAWRAHRGEEHGGAVRALPPVVALPAAALIAWSCASLAWAGDVRDGTEQLLFFTLPFALLLGTLARSPFPDWAPRRIGHAAVALALLFALVGLFQAVTQELFFFDPSVETSNANSDYFRVTSLFGDPSLYGRHLILGIAVVLVALGLRRLDDRLGVGLVALLWAGLFFSYSQSSMVALVAITLAVAAATGSRRTRIAVVGGLTAVALLGTGYVAAIVIRGDSLRRETSDRTQRIEDTARVIRADPVIGVGTGNQPRAAKELSGRDRPVPNFVSHTTPLTVAAELGAVGLAIYLWLLAGAARAILAIRRLEIATGIALGACLLALVTHGLFYPGLLEDPLTWIVLGITAGYLSWPRRDDGRTASTGSGARPDQRSELHSSQAAKEAV